MEETRAEELPKKGSKKTKNFHDERHTNLSTSYLFAIKDGNNETKRNKKRKLMRARAMR